ncbi:nuclear transport factor 2 family protein [Marinobacterium aestuarii]|uniref:nuclear transport factor 2 family protein n=1 Tax=Marinobacterium aestuarii TaxID=1821621 RepID=UPI000A061FA4|nr:nuclear transport factor 2 family protein [Marinobacterium aestuarii]
MDMNQAREFAEEWVESWNAHDLDKILSHYEGDFEMSSPMIRKHENVHSGKLKGKADMSSYWARALERSPNLHFTLINVLLGANSVTVIYEGVRGLSAEVFHFSESGKVEAAYAHYNL